MTFFKSSKHQRLLWSLLLLSVGAAAGFGLGIFCGAEPPVGCRESDLTPVPDESFVSPASASSVETSPEPEPMPEKWVCLTFDDGPSKTTPDVLSALNRAGVKATFFVVATGNNDKYLPLISEAAAAGHHRAPLRLPRVQRHLPERGRLLEGHRPVKGTPRPLRPGRRSAVSALPGRQY